MSKYIRQDDNVQLVGQHVRIHAGVPDDGLGHILAGGLLAAVDHGLKPEESSYIDADRGQSM